jgi:primosomal protein N' (replication factor Y)
VDAEGGDDLKAVLLAPDSEPLFPASLLELGGWISRYYTTPIGLTFRAMLPSALWGSSQLVAEVRDRSSPAGGASKDVMLALARAGGRAPATTLARKLRRPVWETLQRLARAGAVALETEPPSLGPTAGIERVLVLTSVAPSLIERDRVFGRAERQRAAYEAADALGGEVGIRHLIDQLGFSRAVLNGLVDRGLARFEERQKLRDPFGDVVGSTPPRLTSEQMAATNVIRGLPPSHCATLFGVTGSGKTLVYLEAFREEVERGRGIIVLVPEISLTPQTVSRVRGVFGDRVAVLHSGLSDAERADAWRSLAAGQRRVAVGARSAVFAPVQNLAATILDEEHDSSYKHGESPRYHARDVALKRASLENTRVVLVGATPSLETWAAEYRGTRVSLPNRIGAKPLPEVSLVDMRSESRVSESGKVPWSQALDDAVTTELAGGNQIILLLNRRGFAHFLQCETCGKVWDCPNCSISLTVHRTPSRLRCHYCGYEAVVPLSCNDCRSATQRASGMGTQLLEQWLAERYPAARLARMDADTTTAKWSHQRILDAVAERQVDVLFGTQMIAKGLDFPGVTLVGVVDADTGLHLPDFRAAERTFQLISQVAGRAGRGPKGGRVLVQTRTPKHYALTAAAQHDYEGFVACELSSRRSPPYPPHVGLVNVVVSALREADAVQAASDVGDWLRGLVAARAAGAVDVIGPAPAPLARIKRRWRWHILYRSDDRTLLDRITRYAAHKVPHANSRRVRVVFDRDPVSVL